MKEKDNVFSIVENHLGTKITSRSIKKFSKLSSRQAIELNELINSHYWLEYYFLDNDEMPQLSIDETRYAILTDQSGEIDSYEIWNDTNHIKKLLLYYPSIAVLDPLNDVLSLAAEAPEVYGKALSLLLPIRPLIDKGIVKLIPGSSARSTVLKQITLPKFLRKVLSDGTVLSSVRAYDPDMYDFLANENLDLPGMMLDADEMDAVSSLQQANVSKGLLVYSASLIKDFYARFLVADISDSNMTFISEKDSEFYSMLLGGKPDILPTLGKVDDYVAPFILSMQLPDIQKLSWNDVVSIRETDDDFFFWRDALRQVMKNSYSVNQISEVEFRRNAREMLTVKSRYLRETIKQKSSIKDKFLDAWIPAGIGFVSGALTDNLNTAVNQAILTGSLTLLYSLFTKNPSKSEKILYRHFSMFLSEKSA